MRALHVLCMLVLLVINYTTIDANIGVGTGTGVQGSGGYNNGYGGGVGAGSGGYGQNGYNNGYQPPQPSGGQYPYGSGGGVSAGTGAYGNQYGSGGVGVGASSGSFSGPVPSGGYGANQYPQGRVYRRSVGAGGGGIAASGGAQPTGGIGAGVGGGGIGAGVGGYGQATPQPSDAHHHHDSSSGISAGSGDQHHHGASGVSVGAGSGSQPHSSSSSSSGGVGVGAGGKRMRRYSTQVEPYRRMCSNLHDKVICYRLYSDKDTEVPPYFTCTLLSNGMKTCTETENALYLERRNMIVDQAEIARRFYGEPHAAAHESSTRVNVEPRSPHRREHIVDQKQTTDQRDGLIHVVIDPDFETVKMLH